MIVWVTKYALSEGIKELEVIQSDEFPDMVRGKMLNESYYGEGKDWHRTHASAVSRAEEMRKKKIASLKKQLEKFEKMRFI